MSVCLSVIRVVIVDNGQSISFFVFCHKIELVNTILRILNLEGLQNCMICSKVTMILTTFLVHDKLGLLKSGTSLLWAMGKSTREGLWLLGLVTGGR